MTLLVPGPDFPYLLLINMWFTKHLPLSFILLYDCVINSSFSTEATQNADSGTAICSLKGAKMILGCRKWKCPFQDILVTGPGNSSRTTDTLTVVHLSDSMWRSILVMNTNSYVAPVGHTSNKVSECWVDGTTREIELRFHFRFTAQSFCNRLHWLFVWRKRHPKRRGRRGRVTSSTPSACTV